MRSPRHQLQWQRRESIVYQSSVMRSPHRPGPTGEKGDRVPQSQSSCSASPRHRAPATVERREIHERPITVYAFTTHPATGWRGERESIEPIKCMRSPHTSYRWRGERVIEPIKCMRSPHTSYRWRGERAQSQSSVCSHHTPATGGEERETRDNQVDALTTHQLQVERRESHIANQVYALATNQLQVESRERHRANQVDALATHQLQVERRESHRANQVYAFTTHQLQVERRESHRANQVYALNTYQLQVERRESHRDNQVYALTTPARVERRERHRANQCMCSPHTSYRWRGERVIEPIKWMRSPHTSYRWRGESHRANQVDALTTHQLQVERRESHRANQVYAFTTHQLQVQRRENHRANQVYALTTHQLQVERGERHRANRVNGDYQEAIYFYICHLFIQQTLLSKATYIEEYNRRYIIKRQTDTGSACNTNFLIGSVQSKFQPDRESLREREQS